jgi:hypothetical protein
MTVQQIRSLGPALAEFMGEFTECFVDADTQYHLTEYVKGQLSDLPRKSVEPIALLMDVAPRTLQEFLSLSQWDHDQLRDTMQRIIARDQADDQAIGIIDESGHPKKGNKTACVLLVPARLEDGEDRQLRDERASVLCQLRRPIPNDDRQRLVPAGERVGRAGSSS